MLFAGALLGLVLGAVYGIGLVVFRRARRKTAFPLGPFLIAGAFGGLLLGGARRPDGPRGPPLSECRARRRTLDPPVPINPPERDTPGD